MVTWVGVGSHRGVIQRSWWGHFKVTTRLNLLKTVKNSLFLLFLPKLCSLEMYMMSWNIPRSQHGPTQKHPERLQRWQLGLKGFLPPPPPQITFVSTLSHMAPNNTLMVYFDQWPIHLLHLVRPNQSLHGEIGWSCISQGSYPKVMTRSSQSYSKVKSVQHGWK